jgi:hypothetical protein
LSEKIKTKELGFLFPGPLNEEATKGVMVKNILTCPTGIRVEKTTRACEMLPRIE